MGAWWACLCESLRMMRVEGVNAWVSCVNKGVSIWFSWGIVELEDRE